MPLCANKYLAEWGLTEEMNKRKELENIVIDLQEELDMSKDIKWKFPGKLVYPLTHPHTDTCIDKK